MKTIYERHALREVQTRPDGTQFVYANHKLDVARLVPKIVNCRLWTSRDVSYTEGEFAFSKVCRVQDDLKLALPVDCVEIRNREKEPN